MSKNKRGTKRARFSKGQRNKYFQDAKSCQGNMSCIIIIAKLTLLLMCQYYFVLHILSSHCSQQCPRMNTIAISILWHREPRHGKAGTQPTVTLAPSFLCLCSLSHCISFLRCIMTILQL